MKLLLDQGVARSALALLQQMGFEAIHVGEIGMAAATDRAILEEALQREAVVVTFDAHFHALLALHGSVGPSVVRLRVQNLRGPATAQLVARVVEAARDDLERGAVVTSDGERVRVRRLPIG
jgi:predicted nuclease of predicted toxin-antitoxin system